jgi:hypothetical protein
MASSAPISLLRQLLETRFSHLSTEVESLFDQAREHARRDFAEQINQAVRRLRQSAGPEELAATLVDAAGMFAPVVALFRIEDSIARGERVKGVSPEAAERFPMLTAPLSSAAALAGAIETRDLVTAVAAETEVSPELLAFFGHSVNSRVTIIPILSRESKALLYASDVAHTAPLELLCQAAGAMWLALEPVILNVDPPDPPAPELVQIAVPAAPAPKASRAEWESLPAGEQQVHLKAQRFARVQVAEMRLNESQAVQSGRARRALYGALRQPIDSARAGFREQFSSTCPSMVDYLHQELVRTLAQEDAELLGKDYPGPLV